MAKHKICLDAGHYGKYYNQSPANKKYYESVVMWELHLKLKKHLESYGFEVITTRSNRDKDLALTERGKMSKGCDLFLSLHSNAVGDKINDKIDYPVSYVPINGKGDKIGKLLADCIQKVMGTEQAGRIESRRGSNGDYYGVIRGATSVDTIGIIVEHSFHTNTAMTNWLMQGANLDKLAKAEADVIAAHFGIETKESILYRVQVGAYTERANATTMLAKVKAAGFDAFITISDGYYKVQVGAFSKKANADGQLQVLKKAGFEAFITK